MKRKRSFTINEATRVLKKIRFRQKIIHENKTITVDKLRDIYYFVLWKNSSQVEIKFKRKG